MAILMAMLLIRNYWCGNKKLFMALNKIALKAITGKLAYWAIFLENYI